MAPPCHGVAHIKLGKDIRQRKRFTRNDGALTLGLVNSGTTVSVMQLDK